jgi:hypothetical protein
MPIAHQQPRTQNALFAPAAVAKAQFADAVSQGVVAAPVQAVEPPRALVPLELTRLASFADSSPALDETPTVNGIRAAIEPAALSDTQSGRQWLDLFFADIIP